MHAMIRIATQQAGHVSMSIPSKGEAPNLSDPITLRLCRVSQCL